MELRGTIIYHFLCARRCAKYFIHVCTHDIAYLMLTALGDKETHPRSHILKMAEPELRDSFSISKPGHHTTACCYFKQETSHGQGTFKGKLGTFKGNFPWTRLSRENKRKVTLVCAA